MFLGIYSFVSKGLFFLHLNLFNFSSFITFAACIPDTLVSVSNSKMHIFLSEFPENEILLHINVQNISEIWKILSETIFH